MSGAELERERESWKHTLQMDYLSHYKSSGLTRDSERTRERERDPSGIINFMFHYDAFFRMEPLNI